MVEKAKKRREPAMIDHARLCRRLYEIDVFALKGYSGNAARVRELVRRTEKPHYAFTNSACVKVKP